MNDFWQQEFNLIKLELDKVGSGSSSISISSEYKEDKEAFLVFYERYVSGEVGLENQHIKELLTSMLIL